MSSRSFQYSGRFVQNTSHFVKYLVGKWSLLNGNNDETAVPLAMEICKRLENNKMYSELDTFLKGLPPDDIYATNEVIVRARIAVAFETKDYNVVYHLIKSHTFQNGEDLIEVWDKAHYAEEESRSDKPLTSLARFRIRQRNIPPESVCPSGERKKIRLPIASKIILQEWFDANIDYPYPSTDDKKWLAKTTDLTLSQVKTWFANTRRRMHGAMCKKSCKRVCWYKKSRSDHPRGRRSKPRECCQQLSEYNEPAHDEKSGQVDGGNKQECIDLETENEENMEEDVMPILSSDRDEPSTLNCDHLDVRSTPSDSVDVADQESLEYSTTGDDDVSRSPPKLDLVLPPIIHSSPYLGGLTYQTQPYEYVILSSVDMLTCTQQWHHCLFQPGQENKLRLPPISIFIDPLPSNPYEQLYSSITDPFSFNVNPVTCHEQQNVSVYPLNPGCYGTTATPGVTQGSPGHMLRLIAATALLDMSIMNGNDLVY